MEKIEVIKNIATRTGGDIYLGVVGAVRTGKSTFIRRFMENLVIPNIQDEFERKRALDELPQAASGKMIMTTEPKFVPANAAKIMIDEFSANIKMIDCVGYLTKNAIGHLEGDVPRMVSTPWFEKEIPFEEAATLGTKKVIDEHSTIGILITTDGSVTEFDRDDYIESEEKVATQLKSQNKPFVIILNTNNPASNDTKNLCSDMCKKYDAPVLPINCANLSENDINEILGNILYEFPVNEIDINLPRWVDNLDPSYSLRKDVLNLMKNKFSKMQNLRQIKNVLNDMENEEIIDRLKMGEISLGNGVTELDVSLDNNLFYNVLSDISGFNVSEEGDLFSIVTELAQSKRSYDKIEQALNDVKRKGYGIVSPNIEDLTLEEPEIVKQGSKFGVKLRAKAPSLHIIKAEIETEVSPIVGSEKQSEELVNYLLKEFEGDPKSIWQSNIFGKSLHELVNEGLQNKLYKMPEDAQCKFQETLERVINEGSGGLICIIL